MSGQISIQRDRSRRKVPRKKSKGTFVGPRERDCNILIIRWWEPCHFISCAHFRREVPIAPVSSKIYYSAINLCYSRRSHTRASTGQDGRFESRAICHPHCRVGRNDSITRAVPSLAISTRDEILLEPLNITLANGNIVRIIESSLTSARQKFLPLSFLRRERKENEKERKEEFASSDLACTAIKSRLRGGTLFYLRKYQWDTSPFVLTNAPRRWGENSGIFLRTLNYSREINRRVPANA